LIPLGRAVAAEMLAAGLFFTAYVAAARLLGRGRAPLRWVGVVVSAAWIASVEFHVLSAFRAFRLSGAVVAIGLSAALASRIGPGRSACWFWKRDLLWLERASRRLVHGQYRGVVCCVSLLATIVIVHSLLLPPLGWDSLTYHAVKAAKWLQHGGMTRFAAPGTWALYENFWGGAEVLTAWAMLPFHADTLAMALQAGCWVGLGLATVALARELGAREPYASSVAALVLATPTVRMQVGTGYVEVVGLLYLTSGMALAARFLRRPEGGLLVLAAAALGLAAGVKFPYAPVSLLVVVVVSLRALASPRSLRTRAEWIVSAFAVFAASVAPWLWNAYRISGAPLSPMPLDALGVDLGRAVPEVEAYLARPVPHSTFAAELERLVHALLRSYGNPGLPTVAAAALGVLSSPWLLRRRAPGASLILLVLAASMIEYYSPGLSIVRHHSPASSVRFLLVPLVLGAVLGVVPYRGAQGLGRFYLWFLWIGTFVDLGLYLLHDVSPRCAAGVAGLLVVLSALFVAVRRLARWTGPRTVHLAGLVAAASIFLVVVHAAHDRMRTELARVGFVKSPVAPYWLAPSLLVDDPGRPRRIAVTSGPWVMADNWFAYPFLGRRLQNEVLYVPVSRDGVMRHFGSQEVNEAYLRAADFSAWLARLRQAGVTEVMSFSPPSVELAWMEAHPEVFRRVIGDAGDWGLFTSDPRPAETTKP
jgi:hypothetical protein